MPPRLGTSLLALLVCLAASSPAGATDWHVAPDGEGNGRDSSPFGRIQDAIGAARPGDTIVVAPGMYPESLRSIRGGTAAAPIRIRGVRGEVVVTASGRVLTVGHPFLVVEGLILDGQFGASDLVRVTSAARGEGRSATSRNLPMI